MPTKHPDGAVAMAPPDVLHVCVKNMIRKSADKLYIIHPLITEVRRVIIEPEARMVFYRSQRAFSRGDVEGDFRGMHFEGEVNVLLFKHIEKSA